MEAEPSRGTSRDGRKTGFANFSACAAQRAALQMLPASRPHYVVMEMGHFIFYLLFYLFIYFYRYCVAASGSQDLALVYAESRKAPSPWQSLILRIWRWTRSKPTAIYNHYTALSLLLLLLFYWCYHYYNYNYLLLALFCNCILIVVVVSYFATNHIILYHIILDCKTLQCTCHFLIFCIFGNLYWTCHLPLLPLSLFFGMHN